MLDHPTNNPVIIHTQVALPHAAHLPLAIHAPGGIQPHRNLLRTQQALATATVSRHPEDCLRGRPDILVGETRTPDNCVCVEGAAVAEAKAGRVVGHGLDEAAHGYLALGDELGAADVDVVAAAALDQVVLDVDRGVPAVEDGEARLGEGEVAVTRCSYVSGPILLLSRFVNTHGSIEARWANNPCENWPSRASGNVLSIMSAASRGSLSYAPIPWGSMT